MEIYKQVIGAPKYQISNFGNIKSGDRLLSPPTYSTGYRVVKLFEKGKYRRETIHRLVAKHFIENPKGVSIVNHINGVKSDNRVENLEWVTSHENHLHASANGLKAKGETHGVAVLNNKKVLDIKSLLIKGVSQRKIASSFGVCQATIKDINVGKTWKHL